MKGETFLCVATRAWDSMWRESQQQMIRIARDNRVLYFEPGRNPDRSHAGEMVRNARHFLDLAPRVVVDNLFVIPTPSCLPYARRQLSRALQEVTGPLVAGVNAAILRRQISRAMRAHDVRDPILWLYEPRHAPLVGRFGEKLVCYYIYDELADFLGNERVAPLIQRYDTWLTRRADLVFACSPWIWRRRRELTPNAHLVPNAVDFEAFHETLNAPVQLPADLQGLPRPIIGVAGMLDDRVDVGLLRQVAAAYPDWSLVLVGPDRLPDRAQASCLRQAPNVFFVGQKHPRELPEYVRRFDVALIPYVVAPHTLPIYPLKLFEYLAAGRSVVASALPEIAPFGGVIQIAPTREQFVRLVADAALDYARPRVEERVALAGENTWDQHVAEIYRLIAARLAERNGRVP